MKRSLSTQGLKGFLSRSFAFAATSCGWALTLPGTFGSLVRKSTGRLLTSVASDWISSGETPGMSMERKGWEKAVRQGVVTVVPEKPTPRKPQFLFGPLDGLEGFSLDSPSQEFYLPSWRANPDRFAYYVVQDGDWWFIGWRTREQVMAGG